MPAEGDCLQDAGGPGGAGLALQEPHLVLRGHGGHHRPARHTLLLRLLLLYQQDQRYVTSRLLTSCFR